MACKHVRRLLVILVSIIFLASCLSPLAPTRYEVLYSANTGSGTPPTDGKNYQSGYKVTVQGQGSLTKVGYTFAGWNTAANGSGHARAVGSTFVMGNGDVTLYAVWTPVQSVGITITFDVDYQQVVFASSSISVAQGEMLAVSTTNATLASQGSSWLWRMDGATLTGQTGNALSLGTSGVSIGNHILDLFVVYQGVLYSGNLLVTVTP
jgi:uncharacterized repeat protein (TIGR02543 family)